LEVNHLNEDEPLGAARLYQKLPISNQNQINNTILPLGLIVSMQMSPSVQPNQQQNKTKQRTE